MRNKPFILFLLLLCLILTSCRRVKGFPDRYISRDVQPQEFVGVWELSTETLKFIDAEDGNNSVFLKKAQKINLCGDGSCFIEMFSYMPPLSDKTSVCPYIDQSYQCRWELTKDYTYIGHRKAEVQIIKIVATQEILEAEVPRKSSITIRLFIAEKNNDLILWDFIGDPDCYDFRDFVLNQAK